MKHYQIFDLRLTALLTISAFLLLAAPSLYARPGDSIKILSSKKIDELNRQMWVAQFQDKVINAKRYDLAITTMTLNDLYRLKRENPDGFPNADAMFNEAMKANAATNKRFSEVQEAMQKGNGRGILPEIKEPTPEKFIESIGLVLLDSLDPNTFSPRASQAIKSATALLKYHLDIPSRVNATNKFYTDFAEPVDNTFSIAEQIFEACKVDPEFEEVINRVLASAMGGIHVNDSHLFMKILRSNKLISANFKLDKLLETEQLSKEDLDSLQRNFIEFVTKKFKEQTNAIKQASNNQSKPINQVSEESEESKKKLRQENAIAREKAVIGSVNILATIARVLGGPEGAKTAQIIQQVGRGMVLFDQAANQVIDAILSKTFNFVEMLFSVGNLANVVTTIFQAFSFGPSMDQIIIDRLAKLSQQLEAFQSETRDHFTKLNRKLDIYFESLSNQIKNLHVALIQVQNDVSDIKSMVSDLYFKVENITAQLSYIETEIFNNTKNILLTMHELIVIRDQKAKVKFCGKRLRRLKRTTKQVFQSDVDLQRDISKCFEDLSNIATIDAKLSNGLQFANDPKAYGLKFIYKNFVRHGPQNAQNFPWKMHDNLAYLSNFARYVFNQTDLLPDENPLQAQTWAYGAYHFSLIATEFAGKNQDEALKHEVLEELTTLQKMGREIKNEYALLGHKRENGHLVPRTELLFGLSELYSSALEALEQAIQNTRKKILEPVKSGEHKYHGGNPWNMKLDNVARNEYIVDQFFQVQAEQQPIFVQGFQYSIPLNETIFEKTLTPYEIYAFLGTYKRFKYEYRILWGKENQRFVPGTNMRGFVDDYDITHDATIEISIKAAAKLPGDPEVEDIYEDAPKDAPKVLKRYRFPLGEIYLGRKHRVNRPQLDRIIEQDRKNARAEHLKRCRESFPHSHYFHCINLPDKFQEKFGNKSMVEIRNEYKGGIHFHLRKIPLEHEQFQKEVAKQIRDKYFKALAKANSKASYRNKYVIDQVIVPQALETMQLRRSISRQKMLVPICKEQVDDAISGEVVNALQNLSATKELIRTYVRVIFPDFADSVTGELINTLYGPESIIGYEDVKSVLCPAIPDSASEQEKQMHFSDVTTDSSIKGQDDEFKQLAYYFLDSPFKEKTFFKMHKKGDTSVHYDNFPYNEVKTDPLSARYLKFKKKFETRIKKMHDPIIPSFVEQTMKILDTAADLL